ncbi:MAG: type II toxin-antitoxin system VapC family toxin [Pseudomonadales bacterium]
MAFKSLAKNERYENALVIDNSVMMRWLFKDGSASDQQYAKNVLQAIKVEAFTVLVPYLWVYESAFVTHYYTKQQVISQEDASRRLDALFELSTIIRGEEHPNQLLTLAQPYKVSAYDASYLLLAKQQDCPLATLDKKMQKACKAFNGTLYK